LKTSRSSNGPGTSGRSSGLFSSFGGSPGKMGRVQFSRAGFPRAPDSFPAVLAGTALFGPELSKDLFNQGLRFLCVYFST